MPVEGGNFAYAPNERVTNELEIRKRVPGAYLAASHANGNSRMYEVVGTSEVGSVICRNIVTEHTCWFSNLANLILVRDAPPVPDFVPGT